MPNCVNWIIKGKKDIAGHLSDWTNVYVYLSKKAVSKLIFCIKQITSHLNSRKTEKLIIKTITNLIVKWSNYFFPVPKQGSLRLAID